MFVKNKKGLVSCGVRVDEVDRNFCGCRKFLKVTSIKCEKKVGNVGTYKLSRLEFF